MLGWWGVRCSQSFNFSPLGGLCPLFSRLFPSAGRSTQRTVSPGQLGQATAGELGSCGAAPGLWLVAWQSQGNKAGFMGTHQVQVQAESWAPEKRS